MEVTRDIGVKVEALEKFIEEQIYTLPGIEDHKNKLTVVLTGSRAIGTYSEESDVDIDVICSNEDFYKIQNEMVKLGRTSSVNQSFYNFLEEDFERYFGEGIDRPHFSITPIDTIKRQIENYEDIPLWIWTSCLILKDPNNQFKNIVDNFKGYPKDILIKKIKHRYLLSCYWLIDGYPQHHNRKEDMLMASLSILNGIHELYRLFYLLDGKPYPYSEKLALYVENTKLGKLFKGFLEDIIDLVMGNSNYKDIEVWNRLDNAIERMLYGDVSKEAEYLADECDKALIEAGIDETWVQDGYDNVDELLQGFLGPTP